MGHLMLRNMKKVQEALGKLTLAKDGVDGSRIQHYAEAWSFGEASSHLADSKNLFMRVYSP